MQPYNVSNQTEIGINLPEVVNGKAPDWRGGKSLGCFD